MSLRTNGIPGSRGLSHKLLRWGMLLGLVGIGLLSPLIFLRSIVYFDIEIGFALLGVLFVLVLISLPSQNRTVNLGFLYSLLMVSVVINLFWPDYLSIDLPAFPAISPQRIVTIVLVVTWALLLASYRPLLAETLERLKAVGLIGFAVAAALVLKMIAIPFSPYVAMSNAAMVEQVLGWYMMFALAVLVTRTRADIDLLIKVLFYSGAIIGVLCIIERATEVNIFAQYLVKYLPFKSPILDRFEGSGALLSREESYRFRNGLWRAYGPSLTPMNIAQAFAMFVPLGVYLFERAKTRGWRLLIALGIASLIIGAWSTGTRTSMLAAVAILALHLLIVLALKLRKTGGAGRFGPAMTLGLILFVLALPIGFAGSMQKLQWDNALGAQGSRTQMFIHSIPKVKARPIIGYGVGNRVAGTVLDYKFTKDFGSIDSYILTATLETGFPGLIVFLLPIGVMTYFGFRRGVGENHRDARLYYCFGMSGLVFFLTVTTLSEAENHFIFYILLAAFVAFHSGRLADGPPEGTLAPDAAAKARRSRQRRLAQAALR